MDKTKNTLLSFAHFVFILLVFTHLAWTSLATFVTPNHDIAADMLLANRIRDEGWLLVGHYSRWNFNHPGPFWIYYNTLIEWVFSALEVSRYQLWILGSILINAVFALFCSLALATYLLGRRHILLSLLFFVVLVGMVGGDVVSIWMPYRLILPYAAFVICVLHLGNGNWRYLTPGVFFVCILVHGYVTMPVFTLPFFGLACIAGYARTRRALDWGQLRYQLPLSGAIILLFIAPIILDALFYEPSNLSKIIAVQHRFATEPRPHWAEMQAMMNGLLFQFTALKWLFGLPLIAVYLMFTGVGDDEERKPVFWCILAGLVSGALTVFYYKTTPAPVYSFIAQFYVGVPVLMLTASLSLAFRRPGAWQQAGTWGNGLGAIIFLAAVASLLFPIKKLDRPETGGSIVALADAIEQQSAASGPIALEFEDRELWPFMTGFILELDRRHIAACTNRYDMPFLFTPSKLCNQNIQPNYEIVKSTNCNGNCLSDTGEFGFKSSRP